MAGISSTVRDIESNRRVFANSPSWIYYNDGYAPASVSPPGIMHPFGVRKVGSNVSEVLGTDVKLYLVHATNADIGAYEKLATTPATGAIQTDSCTAQSLNTCTIEEWATESGDLDGVSINAGQTMDFSISAKRATSTTEECHLTLEFYHADASDSYNETLLDSVDTGQLTTSYADYTGTWEVSSDQAFDTDDILVLKVINNNTGVPV